LTDTLSLTLGGRYHDQTDKTWDLLPGPNTPGQAAVPGYLVAGNQLSNAGRANGFEHSFSKATYRGVLANQFSNDLMAYISFSQGYNGGGVSRLTLPGST